MPGAKLRLRPRLQFRGMMRHHRRNQRGRALRVMHPLQHITDGLFDRLVLLRLSWLQAKQTLLEVKCLLPSGKFALS